MADVTPNYALKGTLRTSREFPGRLVGAGPLNAALATMVKLFGVVVSLLVPAQAFAKCVPYSPTLADVVVDACAPAQLPSGTFTLVSGRVVSHYLVWLTSEAPGVKPSQQVLSDGPQLLLIADPAASVCPSSGNPHITVLAAPRCCEEECTNKFPVLRLEPRPESTKPRTSRHDG